MTGLLRRWVVVALAGMAFVPAASLADIVTFSKVDKVKETAVDNIKVDKVRETAVDDIFSKVEKAQEKVADNAKGVPFKPVPTVSNPEASSLALMGVAITAATAVGLLRRARKPVA
jgi:hypothetical protein